MTRPAAVGTWRSVWSAPDRYLQSDLICRGTRPAQTFGQHLWSSDTLTAHVSLWQNVHCILGRHVALLVHFIPPLTTFHCFNVYHSGKSHSIANHFHTISQFFSNMQWMYLIMACDDHFMQDVKLRVTLVKRWTPCEPQFSFVLFIV